MDEGQRINITFLHFDIEEEANCGDDWVELDNFSKHCGSISQPWTIISNTNTLTVTFRSDESFTQTGFLAAWTATSEPPTYPTLTGCDSCTFPFVFNIRIFDTCTSIDGDQPWCQANAPAPVDQGGHLINVKSYCSDSDLSCPRTPQMSINPKNQLGNCCKFQELSFNFCLKNNV